MIGFVKPVPVRDTGLNSNGFLILRTSCVNGSPDEVMSVMIRIVLALVCVCFLSGLFWSPQVADSLANFFYNDPIAWIICLVGVFLAVAVLFFWALETALFRSVKQRCR